VLLWPSYRCPTHTGAVKYEGRILFLYAQKSVFLMLFENDVAEFSDNNSHPKATMILHSVCGRNPHFYSSNTSDEIEICWIPNTTIHRAETGSKNACFLAYLRYSVPIHNSFKYTPSFNSVFYLNISRNHISIISKN
jgi:hypothetical protein